MHGDRKFRSIVVVQGGIFFRALASFAILSAGCNSAQPGAAPLVDSKEQVLKDRIAHLNKAAKVMATITDEKSADAAVPQLKELCEENQRIKARGKAFEKTWTKEVKAALDKKYAEAHQAAVDYYAKASGPFSNGSRLQFLHKYLAKQHGIDIQRMKLVEMK